MVDEARVPRGDGEGFLDAEVPLTIQLPEISEVAFVGAPARFYVGTMVRLRRSTARSCADW